MKDIRAKILSNEKVGPDYFKMALEAPYIAKNARPGQIVMVRCSSGSDPLLRRPFGVHRVRSKNQFEMLYEVVGKGTTLLSNKQKGDFIDILGPLGNGFTMPLSAKRYPLSAILIAGGIGVAPLVFLAEKLAEVKSQKAKVKIIVLIGAKTKKLILCEKDFQKIGAEVHTATDDGTGVCKGPVSQLFEKILRVTGHGSRVTTYACGPQPMIQCIAEIARKNKIPCQATLEEKMSCGIGVCLGCAVKVKAKKGFTYKLACKDGPIFNTSRLIW